MNRIIVSLALASAALLSSLNAFSQATNENYIGMNKTADYDYTSHTGIITLESYVKGYMKLTKVAKPVDIVLVLDFSTTMQNEYKPSDGHTTFNGLTTGYYANNKIQTQYTYETLGSKITYNGTSYSTTKISVDNPNDGNNSYKWAYITINGNRHYLCSDGIAYKAKSNSNPTASSWPQDEYGRKIAPVVKKTEEIIWTDFGSNIQSRDISKRIHALFSSVENFINGIHDHAVQNNVDDRLSVVTFRQPMYPKFNYGNGSDRAKYITSGTDIYLKEFHAEFTGIIIPDETVVNVNNRPAKDANTIKSIMNSLYNMDVNGLTAANYGLTLGNECLKDHGYTDDTHAKFVVFFTDGRPELQGGSTFDTDAANKAIAVANTIKQTSGATVYSIYCNNSIDSNIETYMNAVSSNYPSATSMTSLGTAAEEKKYYYSAETNLYEVFDLIKKEIQKMTGVQYGPETVMNDFINNTYFKLASYVDPSDPWKYVDVFKVKCTGMTADSTRTFSTAKADSVALTAADGIVLYLEKSEGEGENDRILVSGFNYSQNWCGLDENNNPHGNKLVVKVPFEFTGGMDTPVPGTVKTNGDDSGIYPAVRDSTTGEVIIDTTTNLPVYEDTPESEYESPTINFCTVRIIRHGLDKGESAIYEVTCDGNFVARISLNGTDDAVVMKCLYGLAGGTYTVTETGWNWAYNKKVRNDSGTFVDGNVITKNVNDSNTVFEFEFGGEHKTGTGPEDLHNHDEEYKVNLIRVDDL